MFFYRFIIFSFIPLGGQSLCGPCLQVLGGLAQKLARAFGESMYSLNKYSEVSLRRESLRGDYVTAVREKRLTEGSPQFEK